MKFINYNIVRFSIFLTLGILAAKIHSVSFFMLFPLLGSLLLTTVLWFFAKRNPIQTNYFGFSVYLTFSLLGYTVYQLHQPEFQKEHYSHFLQENTPQILQLKIKEVLKPDAYNQKYYAEIRTVNSEKTLGKILLTFPTAEFEPDDVLLVYTSFSEIQKPLNPNQFDYSAYMKSQKVFHQIALSNTSVIKTEKGRKTFFGTAQNFRGFLVEKLKKTPIPKDERAIVQALILGDKKDIEKELYEDYAAAGAVHILAVSGLHVGILFFILSFLFRPLIHLKYGRIFQSILIVLILWGFAFMAGLSPSVVRSVSMFSFFALAMILGRRTNGLNTLFLSYLFLLTINPLWLFQVGFQLSYFAVFFILWMQPIFNELGYSRYALIRKARGLITVSVSAQLGVLPLTLFYFHQFPGLFLITNLVVLPVLTIFMGGGILIVALASINGLPNWLADTYTVMVEGLNTFIGWIAQQEKFIFSEIHFSGWKVVGTYFLLATLIIWIKTRKTSNFILFLIGISIFQGICIFEKTIHTESEFIVFHKNRECIMGVKHLTNFTFFNPEKVESYPFQSYKIKTNIQHVAHTSLPEVFRYDDQTFLVLDSLGTYPKKRKIDVLLLTHSPKINLGRIIDSLQPVQIVADGSNYPSFVETWKNQSELRGIPFHYTGKDGAYVLR